MTGWFAQENIGSMDIYHHRPSPTARRFESGTPNVCGLYAVSAGLEFLMQVGLEAVDAQVRILTTEIAQRIKARGWKLVTPAEPERHGATMALATTDAPRLVALLDAAGIVLSDRDGNVRISTHIYNNLADLDHLFQELDRNAGLIRRG
jgi:selenocysteine lyase/cysteine desulfurase